MQNYLLFKERRSRFIQSLKNEHHLVQKGCVILYGGFEQDLHLFRQESSLYYLTGLTEPGVVIMLYFDGREEVYIANAGKEREKWVNVELQINENDGGKSAKKIGATTIKYLGKQINGYSIGSFFHKDEYETLISDLYNVVEADYCIFILTDNNRSLYETQIQRFSDCAYYVKKLKDRIVDVSSVVHEMRKTKDDYEVSFIQKAIDITLEAQKAAAKAIEPGILEYQVRAALEYQFNFLGAVRPSFPSIVATGKNSTVLHYTELNQKIKDDDLVVVDIGAEFGYYAADITRTYPAIGKFSERQREVYEVVLATQEYVASIAKPGIYLINSEEQENSLHHLSVAFLKERGFDKYFVHGIGHFLGLDVHDVGDYSVPLKPGNVFTIEPGIYISEENLGVRIEDDYLISDDGCICLSADLPKKPSDIEQMMR